MTYLIHWLLEQFTENNFRNEYNRLSGKKNALGTSLSTSGIYLATSILQSGGAVSSSPFSPACEEVTVGLQRHSWANLAASNGDVRPSEVLLSPLHLGK